MELYFGRNSGNSARAAFCLHEAGCAFESHPLDYRKGENRAAAYVALNPMGKIPTLRDGSVTLWESNAINWYVAEKNPAAHLLPGTIEGRASVQRWLFFQSAHVTPACLPVMRSINGRIRAAFQTAPDEAAVAQGRKELDRYLPVLDEAMRDREWLERKFSLADISYAPHLYLLKEGGFSMQPWPHLSSWLDRLYARPAWRKTVSLVF